jgi:hypothetical protein
MGGYELVKIHTNSLVAVLGVQHRLVHSVLVIRESSIVQHAMYPMYTMFYQEDKAVRVKLSIRAAKNVV